MRQDDQIAKPNIITQLMSQSQIRVGYSNIVANVDLPWKDFKFEKEINLTLSQEMEENIFGLAHLGAISFYLQEGSTPFRLDYIRMSKFDLEMVEDFKEINAEKQAKKDSLFFFEFPSKINYIPMKISNVSTNEFLKEFTSKATSL